MKLLKRLALILLFILGIGFLAGVFSYQFLKPDYDGVKTLPGLSREVEVYFDTYGIPHIYGQSEKDAFKALGYVHAQDRLWQMELLRRVAGGGLSEVFGKELVKTDRFFLALGIDAASREAVAGLDMSAPEVQLAEAYLEGVNQFINSGPTPVEFYLTGIDKRPFTLRDIHNALGYMAFSFAMAHKTDPLLSFIKDSIGAAYLNDLQIGYDSTATRIRNYLPVAMDSVDTQLADAVSIALRDLPVPQLIGSNSWVVAPAKAKNGKVILANDPHIGFAQPSVWYEAHLVTPTYEKYGYHLAGIPFPILGHDRKVAYGITMFENDDLDFYYEQGHPSDSTLYQGAEGWEGYDYASHTIKVKGGKDETFSTRHTRRGPVMNDLSDQITSNRPVSMSWTYTRLPNQLLSVLYGISHATNLGEFQEELPNLHAPGLNMMYGDAEGNIAWWAAARLYTLPDSLNNKLIMEAPKGTGETIQYKDFTHNPKAINPPWNYVYSANNQPEPLADKPYPGYYLPENRARRIVEILDSKDNWDKEAVKVMILDDTSPVNPEIIGDLVQSIDVTKLEDGQIKILDMLTKWEGNYPLKTIEPTIFHSWIYYFLKYSFADELGEERFKQLLSTHFHKRLIAPLAKQEGSVWFDDIDTPEKKESKKDIIQHAFQSAFQSLEKQLGDEVQYWTWDRVHRLEHEHPIGRVSYLRSFFNVGPFPVRGSREVINNMAFTYNETGENRVHSGPPTRRIVDFSDIENSLSILPTGQSGNPFSAHYDDQAQMYILGKFRKMLLNEEEIKTQNKSLLVFKAADN